MTSNFLQRFKGKTQQISKESVYQILGSKQSEPLTNPTRESNSVNKKTNTSTNSTFMAEKKKPPAPKVASSAAKQNTKKAQNPFLVSNPFYLDEEELRKQEIQRKERKLLEESIRKAQQPEDQKQTTKTSGYSRSLDKKKATRQWVKLGGLGANIGGDDWAQRKKKKDKMQEFSSQVKSINAERTRPPRPEKKQEPKEFNARQKALEYSRNVRPPAPRREQEQRDEQPQYREQQLTQLQLCEMKREQLRRMLDQQ